jgi:hypothetical protein
VNDEGPAETDGVTDPDGIERGESRRRRCPQKRHRRKKAASDEERPNGTTRANHRPAKRPGAHFSGPVPRFFRHPDHASEEEKPHLYGPFYVAWPKNRQMPSSYAELAQIYGRR